MNAFFIIDMHCPGCGACTITDSPVFVFCNRCGEQMSSWAPLQSVSDERERLWLATPAGKEWKRKNDKNPSQKLGN